MGTQVFRTAALGGVAGAALLLALASGAEAQTIASDRAAGYVLFPQIISDPNDAFNQGQTTETLIQLTNTDSVDHAVHCFYVNATGRCTAGVNANGEVDCRVNSDCNVGSPTAPLPGVCDTSIWEERNFTMILTAQQPVGWVAAAGGTVGDDPNDPNVPQVGTGAIPPVPTNYFQGDLKCVEVDDFETVVPINANHLKGEATTYVVTSDPNDPNATSVDVRRYNAIGIQALSNNGATQNDRTLCLGGNGLVGNVCEFAEYASCPERLILNHLFEGAYGDDLDADPSVTLVPCTQRFDQDPQQATNVTAQMLVFNEFEQRFSLSTRVECYRDINLRDLSILFDLGTQGTIAGQTIFKPVSTGNVATAGFGLLGVGQLNSDIGSTAYNIVYSGVNENAADFVSYVFPDSD